MNKIYNIFNTDFYQLTMGFSYVISGKNSEKTAFEGFVRHTKKTVNPFGDFYIFDGENEVIEFMEKIKQELNDPDIVEKFIELVSPKITAKNKSELIEQFRTNWKNINKDFEYTVIPNGTIVKPYVPVFQFYGDKMIGQMIETPVTNIYNGKTGLNTIKYLILNGFIDNISTDDFRYISGIVQEDKEVLDIYESKLIEAAKEFRDSTKEIILEAGFRRAPSPMAANIASKIAIENGWNGSSNVFAYQQNMIKEENIGGSMAHAFVMSYETERQAIIDYDKIFPGTTILIDTYDVVNCMNLIVDMINKKEITKPKFVRIDSDPLEYYIEEVNKIIVSNNLDIGIFVSGDMTPQRLTELKNYKASMAGTKYVYTDSDIEKVNCGFVYKIVQYVDKNGITVKPEKKATGKSNYSGIKNVFYNEDTNILTVDTSGNYFGFQNIENIKVNTEVVFI